MMTPWLPLPPSPKQLMSMDDAACKNRRRMIRPTLPIISIVIYLDMIIIFGTRVECGALVVGSYYHHVVAEPHYGTPDNGSCMPSKADTPLKPLVRRGVILSGGCGWDGRVAGAKEEDVVGVGE